MAGTRAYRRDSHGRFAGSGGGTKVTYGKAGGFANSAFRARVAGQRASGLGSKAGAQRTVSRPSRNRSYVKKALTGAAASAVGVGVGALLAGGAVRVASNASRNSWTKALTSGSVKSAPPKVPGQPNYAAAVGTKEYVGRRVTDGNYGFVLKAGKR
jgi:hypothetical protein